LRAAVEAAVTFEPKLHEFVLATTTDSDARIQALARQLTEDHRAKDLFRVHVLSWPELVTRMADHYPELIEELLRMPARSPAAARAQLQQIQHELESCVRTATELQQVWLSRPRTLSHRVWTEVGPELHRGSWLTLEEYVALADFFDQCAHINDAFQAAAQVNVHGPDRRAGQVVLQPKLLLDDLFRPSEQRNSKVVAARSAIEIALGRVA